MAVSVETGLVVGFVGFNGFAHLFCSSQRSGLDGMPFYL